MDDDWCRGLCVAIERTSRDIVGRSNDGRVGIAVLVVLPLDSAMDDSTPLVGIVLAVTVAMLCGCVQGRMLGYE